MEDTAPPKRVRRETPQTFSACVGETRTSFDRMRKQRPNLKAQTAILERIVVCLERMAENFE